MNMILFFMEKSLFFLECNLDEVLDGELTKGTNFQTFYEIKLDNKINGISKKYVVLGISRDSKLRPIFEFNSSIYYKQKIERFNKKFSKLEESFS